VSAVLRKPEPPIPTGPEATEPPRPNPKLVLGQGSPRGYGMRPKLSPDAAAAFATYVDSARARAAVEGRTLVYTVRWN
jgi:hypothetical protein